MISLRRARALAATLGRDPDALGPGDPLPAGWHWIHFNALTPRDDLAPDGHARRGAFLPPIPHPHRMWAGGSISFPGALRIGEEAVRVSTIESIEEKEGRSGPLVFVTIRHDMSHGDRLAVREEQRLVFLTRAGGAEATPPGGAEDALRDMEWSERFVADEVTLFRFSALTLNSHRIHYDHPYATRVEGYPGLVVHGPLLALVLLDAGVRHAPDGMAAAGFTYRARRPLFCGEELRVGGRTDRSTRLVGVHEGRGVTTEGALELKPGATAAM